jgi:hypothetical protein
MSSVWANLIKIASKRPSVKLLDIIEKMKETDEKNLVLPNEFAYSVHLLRRQQAGKKIKH